MLGRSSACLVSIKDPHVSREHLRVVSGDGALYAEDMRSSNGTWVNEQPLRNRQALAHGDVVRIGETALVVELAGAVG